MAAPRFAERTRHRLIALLREDRSDPERLMQRLREFRQLEEVPACSEALRTLVHLDMSETQAEVVLGEILAHRGRLERALGRDPGTLVAATDFLTNVETLLVNPKVVEITDFEATERSAITDPLTGLYNRRVFRSAMRREGRRSQRYGQTFSLLMLDLDRFKEVNDRFGHVHGDLVLQRVASLIRRALREADVACRYGGDEFAVIFPQTDRLGAYAVAERLRRLVRDATARQSTGGQAIPITVSGGVSCFPDDGVEMTRLIERADETLYQAKRSGRDRISLHPAERRRAVRFPARPRSRVAILGPAGTAAARAIDLSVWGALLETDPELSLDPSDPVRLVLGDVPSPGSPPEPVVEASVVRVDAAGRNTKLARIALTFASPLPEPVLRRHVVRGPGGRGLAGERE